MYRSIMQWFLKTEVGDKVTSTYKMEIESIIGKLCLIHILDESSS